MKKKYLFLVVFSMLFLTFSVSPTIAVVTNTPEGITLGSTPLTDAENDVYEHTSPADPWSGTPGNGHPEIDLKELLRGSALTLECYAPLKFSTSGYLYLVYISCDGDASTYEYLVTASASGVKLVDTVNEKYWNGSHWTTNDDDNCSYSILTNALRINSIAAAIPSIVDCKMAARSMYLAASPYYSDRLVGAGGGIPSFTWIPLLFSLATLLGIVFILHRQKTPF